MASTTNLVKSFWSCRNPIWGSVWTNSSNYSNIRIVGYRIVLFDSIFGQILGTEFYSNIRIIGTEYPNSWKEPFLAQNLDFLTKSYKFLPIFMSLHKIFLNDMMIMKNSSIFSYLMKTLSETYEFWAFLSMIWPNFCLLKVLRIIWIIRIIRSELFVYSIRSNIAYE